MSTFVTCSALEESIPNLCAFMDDDLSSVTSHQSIKSFNANDLTQQLKFLLSKLVYAISRESHPIAILFEDLHWADRYALGKLFDLSYISSSSLGLTYQHPRHPPNYDGRQEHCILSILCELS